MTNKLARDRSPRDAPPVSPVPIATELQPGPLTRPAAPVPGDPDSEWQTCDADLPAVKEALTALCKRLRLQNRSSRTQVYWHHELINLELWIDITIVADGDATLVGLRIRPVRGTFVPEPDSYLHSFLPATAILFVALFLVDARLFPATLVYFVLNLLFQGLVFGVGVLQRRRLRAQQEWASAWRREFWAALHGRVVPRALYR